MTPALLQLYTKQVVPALQAQFGYKNVMQVPKVTKITINVGYGRQHKDKVYIENAEKTLSLISGQKPMHNKAKKSISNFKIREGMPIGVSVTIRGPRMYDFLQKLIHISLPRVRDFRGIDPKSFDAQGNYTLGLKENAAFPEIVIESLDKIHGLQIVISTNAHNKAEGRALLTGLGFPFRDK